VACIGSIRSPASRHLRLGWPTVGKGWAAVAFHANRSTLCLGSISISRAAFLAFWWAGWARKSAPMIRPSQITSKFLGDHGCYYSGLGREEHAGNPRCGLCGPLFHHDRVIPAPETTLDTLAELPTVLTAISATAAERRQLAVLSCKVRGLTPVHLRPARAVSWRTLDGNCLTVTKGEFHSGEI